MTQSFKSSRVSIPGTIYTNGFVWSYRTRAPVGLKTETFLETSASRASTIFVSAANPPPGSGNWRRTIEHANSLATLVRRLFLSSLQSLQKPESVFSVLFRPTSFVPSHANNKAWSNGYGVHENRAKGAGNE